VGSVAVDGYRLGIDFGTSNTVAALAGPDGRVRPLLFDGSPLLASAVFAGPGPELLVGADALRTAVGSPAGLEPNPKRRIDDGTVWLGEREVPVGSIIAAVLERVCVEAERVAGAVPVDVVLTHPAVWGKHRQGVLAAAAGRAGLGAVRFVAEPIAAAAYFTTVLDRRIGLRQSVVVYDLGAGTFDVSVVRRSPGGFEVVVSDGLSDVGGLDLDAAVVRHARELTAGDHAAWQRLDWPQTPADHLGRQGLWQAARSVKEQLSRHAGGDLHLPVVDQRIHLTREEFEKAAGEYLDRTAVLTRTVLRTAGIPPEDIAGVFLVGGSSRIPLAATLLHRALRIAPTVIDQPELVVAEGALHTRPEPVPAAAPSAAAPPAASAAAPKATPRTTLPSKTVLPKAAPLRTASVRRSRRTRTVAVATAVVVLAAAVVLAVTRPWEKSPGGSNGPHAERIGVLNGHTGEVSLVAFSRDGRTLASVGADKTLRLWDVGGRAQLGGPIALADGTFNYGVAFNADGTVAVAAGTAGVRRWEATTHQDLGQFINGTANSVAFSPDGRLVAVTSGTTVRFFETERARPLGEQGSAHLDTVTCAAFSPDGRKFASASKDGTVRFWDVDARKPLGERLFRHTGAVTSVAFSPDARTLASAGEDSTVRLWDVSSEVPVGEPLRAAYRAGRFRRLGFSADGTTLVTIDVDSRIQLWSVAGRKPAGGPYRPDSRAKDLAVSPAGTTFAIAGSGGDGTSIELWRIVP
jgi:hypothetical protein